MTDALINAVARAIKNETDTFGSPVCCYVEPESRERWDPKRTYAAMLAARLR